MAMIELVDFNDLYTGGKKAAAGTKAKSTRRRGKKTGGAKTKATEKKAEASGEAAAE